VVSFFARAIATIVFPVTVSPVISMFFAKLKDLRL
jgi:hypothetical protein